MSGSSSSSSCPPMGGLCVDSCVDELDFGDESDEIGGFPKQILKYLEHSHGSLPSGTGGKTGPFLEEKSLFSVDPMTDGATADTGGAPVGNVASCAVVESDVGLLRLDGVSLAQAEKTFLEPKL